MAKNAVKSVLRTQLNTATLNTTYQAINPNGLPFACFAVRITNISGAILDISYDGETDNEIMSVNSSLFLEFQSQSQPNAKVSLWEKGTIFYAASDAPGAGSVYLSGYYVQ